jgi:FMN-dependent NADH-azoreductase
MHNFSVPSVVKLWIDQIVRAGRTFSYDGRTRVGLLGGKKATFVMASGGVYDPQSPAAAMNFVEPYLRTIFGQLGVKDIEFINAGGTAQLQHGTAREVVLQPARASILAHFQTA